MGREARKAVGNPWYEARKRAAEYDDRLSSREGQPKVSECRYPLWQMRSWA